MTSIKLLLASVAFAVVGANLFGPALARAADLPPVLPIPHRAAAYVPYYSWNGAYVGLNAGYGWGTSQWSDTTNGVSTGTFNIGGGVVGGTAGYNWQRGAWVLGAETDFDWSGIKGSTASATCGGSCTTNNTWLGTFRGRFGVVSNRFLIYLTAGGAYGNLKISDGGGSASISKVGWTYGGGIETAITPAWTAKLEYLYVDLGKATCDAACSGGDPFDVTYKTIIVRGGVNYRF